VHFSGTNRQAENGIDAPSLKRPVARASALSIVIRFMIDRIAFYRSCAENTLLSTSHATLHI
jgi:hypothetical protein